MQTTKTDITQLAENAKTGDPEAIEMLVTHFHKDIFKMVFYRTGSKMDAEDITQDIFVKLVNNIHSIRDTSLFKAWLYRIAVNKVTDHYRKKAVLSLFVSKPETEDAPWTASEEKISSETPSDALMKKEFYTSLFNFTKTLAKREKEVFLLRFIDQLGIKEIAQTINKNESTVKTHLYRSIKKFRGNAEFRNILGGSHES